MPVGPARILASRSCAAAPVAVMLPAPFLDWLMVAALAISFRLRGTTVGDLGFSVLENLSINASDASRFAVLGVRFPQVWRLLCPFEAERDAVVFARVWAVSWIDEHERQLTAPNA